MIFLQLDSNAFKPCALKGFSLVNSEVSTGFADQSSEDTQSPESFDNAGIPGIFTPGILYLCAFAPEPLNGHEAPKSTTGAL